MHWVVPELDAGPSILQRRVPILPGDTADSLGARILVEEHRAYPDALAMVARRGGPFISRGIRLRRRPRPLQGD